MSSNMTLEEIAARRTRLRELFEKNDAVLLEKGRKARLLSAKGEIRRQVRNGAALLDRELPSWRKKIDPDELDMVDGDRCVLGQLFNPTHDPDAADQGYCRGCAYLFDETLDGDAEAQGHGFANRDSYWDHEDFPFTDVQLLELDQLLHEEWVLRLKAP